MKAEHQGVNNGRGVVAGLALLACTATAPDDTLRELVHRTYRDYSYVLVEAPDEPPRLLLLFESVAAAESTNTTRIGVDLRNALAALAGDDDEDREEAVLALGDLNADPRFLVGLLRDPSPAVRDAAAAVLEDLAETAR